MANKPVFKIFFIKSWFKEEGKIVKDLFDNYYNLVDFFLYTTDGCMMYYKDIVTAIKFLNYLLFNY